MFGGGGQVRKNHVNQPSPLIARTRRGRGKAVLSGGWPSPCPQLSIPRRGRAHGAAGISGANTNCPSKLWGYVCVRATQLVLCLTRARLCFVALKTVCFPCVSKLQDELEDKLQRWDLGRAARTWIRIKCIGSVGVLSHYSRGSGSSSCASPTGAAAWARTPREQRKQRRRPVVCVPALAPPKARAAASFSPRISADVSTTPRTRHSLCVGLTSKVLACCSRHCVDEAGGGEAQGRQRRGGLEAAVRLCAPSMCVCGGGGFVCRGILPRQMMVPRCGAVSSLLMGRGPNARRPCFNPSTQRRAAKGERLKHLGGALCTRLLQGCRGARPLSCFVRA